MTKLINKTRLVLAFALSCALMAVFALPALAVDVTSPIKVSDDTTHFRMAKLAEDTHEYVPGAKMAIIEKATNKVVASWTTGDSTYELDKVLDVDKHYILRELAAPAGYGLAPDVEFYVNASETEGITLVNAGTAELTDAITVALYDKKLTTEQEKVVTRTRTNTTGDADRTTAPKTGDETPLELVAVLAGVAIVLAALLQLLKPRKQR